MLVPRVVRQQDDKLPTWMQLGFKKLIPVLVVSSCSGNLRVPMCVCEISAVRFVLDTCASISLLPASFGVYPGRENCDVRAQTASGEPMNLLVKRLLNFKLLWVQYAHWFYVTNQIDMPILGSDLFLKWD